MQKECKAGGNVNYYTGKGMRTGFVKSVLSRRITAWLLTLVMAASVLAAVPAKQAKAAETDISLISAAITESTAANDVGKYQIDFNNNSGYSTYTALANAGYTTLVVKLTCTTYTKAVSANVAGVMSYFSHGGGKWETQWENLVTGSEIVITQDLTNQSESGDTIDGFGVLFDSLEPGSALSYSITSAYLQKTGSDNGGSSSEDTDWEVDNDKITLSYTYEDLYSDYTQYYFYVNNDNSTSVNGDLKITFSSAVTIHWATSNFSVSASGNVLTVSNLSIEPNSSTSGIQAQLKPLGNTITSITFAGQTIGIGTSKSSGVELEYEMRGQLDKEDKDTPVGRHGALSLAKKEGYGNAPVIVDSSGKPFRLRGASMHGMHWFPEFVNKSAFQSLRDDFGVNMVRLVCYPDDKEGTGGGYLTGYGSDLDTLIEKGMAYCTELGMYGMIDWHVHNWNPNDEMAAAKTFFTKYANKYKDYNNVIYEICNEPNATQWYNNTSSDLYTYCKTIVDLIRSIDDDALIVCGTGNWSQWVDQVAAKPIDDDKVLYTLHFYSGTHKAGGLGATMETAIAAGTPVFITEFGVCDASGNGGYDLDEADKWESLMEKYNISCACWSCCNKGESASYFKPGTAATGNWTAANLTKSGGWLLNTYRKLDAEEEEAYANQEDPVEKNVLSDSDITFPTASAITYGQTLAESTLSKTSDDYGTYAWKTSSTKPDAGTFEAEVIYTPTKTADNDYSKLTGYDSTTKKVVRKVSVTVNKLVINSVDFPTVKYPEGASAVASGTLLSDIELSKTSDDYGTFEWDIQAGEENVKVSNDTTGYNVVYRIKDASNTILADTIEGVTVERNKVVREVSFKVSKVYAATDVPSAPTLKAKTDTTVTLDAYTGDGAATIQYGYKKTGSEDDYLWQSSPEFTGLTEWTTYAFAMRYADTVNYAVPGNAGEALIVSTYLSDSRKYTVALSELTTAKAADYVESHRGTIDYNEETKTLTLNEPQEYTIVGVGVDITIIACDGASITMGPANFKKLISDGDITLELSGNNTIDEGIEITKNGSPAGTLTIRNADTVDDGILKVSGEAATVLAETIDIVGGKLTAKSTGTSEDCAAIIAETVNLNGGDLEAEASGAAAVEADAVTVEAGTLKAVGTGSAAGIEADKVLIGGGSVTATAANAAAITTGEAESGKVELLGGYVTVNNQSDSVKPIVSAKIIYDGAVVNSDSDPWYSTPPVDKEGNSITFAIVTFKNGEDVKTSQVTIGSDITMREAAEKSGYKFQGWYKDDAADKLLAAGDIFNVTGAVTFTASYIEITGELQIAAPETVAALKEGYSASESVITVAVKNNTNVTVDKIMVALSGADKDYYSIDKTEISELESGESANVSLALNTELAASAKGYTVNLTFANNEVMPVSDTFTVTRKVYLRDEDCFKVDVSKLKSADSAGDYVEIHSGTISYGDGVLTLETGGTYTITGENENLVIKVKDGVNANVSLVKATVKDIQGANEIAKDADSKVLTQESGDGTDDNGDDSDDNGDDADDKDDGSDDNDGDSGDGGSGDNSGGSEENPDIPEIKGELSVTNEPYIDPLQEGYAEAVVKLTIKNESNIKLGSVEISLAEGEDSGQYSLSDTTVAGLETGASKIVTVTLKNGLSAKAAGYKTTVVIANKELNQQIKVPITRKVYLSDEDSFKIDVSKLDEPGYIEIHNGKISYETTTGANGEKVAVLNLEDDAAYTIIGANAAVIVRSRKEGVAVNLNDATVKDVQGTSNYTLNGTSSLAAPEGKDSTDETDTSVAAQGLLLKANVKGVNGLAVSGTMKLAIKKTMQLKVSFTPEEADEQDVTYTSSNPKVATVSGSGKITAKKAGKTTITVKSESGLTKSFKVQVMKKPVKKVIIKTSKKTVKVKKTLKLKTTLTPNKKQASTSVYWKSGNEKIATVTQKGVVKGVKKGKVKITAIATDGSGRKATVKIQVK